jgi:hypothetical protein
MLAVHPILLAVLCACDCADQCRSGYLWISF